VVDFFIFYLALSSGKIWQVVLRYSRLVTWFLEYLLEIMAKSIWSLGSLIIHVKMSLDSPTNNRRCNDIRQNFILL
jgi:hypothetical protein